MLTGDLNVRLALLAAALLALSACGDRKPADSAAAPSAELRAQVDNETPYAGQWAADPRLCSDAKQLWTIEARRMGVPAAERFCFFNRIYVGENRSEAGATWSAQAECEASGSRVQAFIFFRLQPDWASMKVTLNDDASVNLVRCSAAAPSAT
jgi:hypothetical protein